ncbi:MAG: SDR family NAD(P)-dependent oxidoreductase [Lysobacteraceae bacterium]|nr:MAG: SDR family NAD(P)-dependent oxidoreductase [Xanthomonadaceae bacterium]
MTQPGFPQTADSASDASDAFAATQPYRRPLAVVTGASSGIGLQLARCAAQEGYDILAAADTPLEDAAGMLRALGAEVQTLQVDLAQPDGVARLREAIGARPVDALMANAGHGLGGGFLDQDFRAVQHVIDTNITGTLYVIQHVARGMKAQGRGRILITGSIAGFQPGSFQAVYNASKAFVDSFAAALRNELKDTGVTVSCLMPGVTETGFFERAGMLDTKVGADEDKADPVDVARIGFKAMQDGEADVVAGLMNKLQVVMAKLTPSQVAAEQHRRLAEPGSAREVLTVEHVNNLP